MANLTDLLNQTRYFLDDDSSARVNDDELIFYINTAIEYYYQILANKNYPRLLKSTVLTLTDNKAEIPTDFYKAKIVYAISGNDLIPLDYIVNYEYTEDTTTGLDCESYSFEGNYIKVNSLTTSSIRLTYYRILDELELVTDEVDTCFLPMWTKMIPVKAALLSKAGREEEDTTELTNKLNVFEQPFFDYLTKMTNSRTYVQRFLS